MSLTLAMVVPVPHIAGERGRWSELAHRYIPLAHAEAQARRGHQVHLYFDGPRETVPWAQRVTVHVSRGHLPSVRGALRSPHLVQAALRNEPDVLHLHHLLNLESLWFAARSPVRVFAEYHGGAPPQVHVRRALIRRASHRLAGAFFASAEHHRRLVAAGVWSGAVPFAVSPETTSRLDVLSPRAASAPGAPRVLVVGRTEAPKAPMSTLATLRVLLSLSPGAEVRWASPGGRDLGAVQDILRTDLVLQGRVHIEEVPFERMAQTYAWADLTLATSQREIGGTVLSESLSQGTPFAAYSLPTFHALAANCAAVRLVPQGDALALGKAAQDLLAQSGLRDQARAHFQNELCFDAIAAQRERVYLTEPRARRSAFGFE